jgi:hypothetical protein
LRRSHAANRRILQFDLIGKLRLRASACQSENTKQLLKN